MANPRWCRKCKRGDNGNGIFHSQERWSDKFLTETNKNIVDFGEMVILDACESCVKDIKSRGNLVRRKR